MTAKRMSDQATNRRLAVLEWKGAQRAHMDCPSRSVHHGDPGGHPIDSRRQHESSHR